jgi:hypothetical protein
VKIYRLSIDLNINLENKGDSQVSKAIVEKILVRRNMIYKFIAMPT